MRSRSKALLAWALYDFASSPYGSIIQTFVYATYFVRHVAVNETKGASLWAVAMGVAGLVVALMGPFLGALADSGGGRKRLLGAFTLLTIASTALLWFVRPDPAYTGLGLLLAAIGTAAVEIAYIFYNAMLPDLAERDTIGRWSGWGWAAGYAGGVLALALSWLLFHLDSASTQDIRATFLLTAAWYACFALPLFLWVPEREAEQPTPHLFGEAWQMLMRTLKEVRAHANIFKFLMARMIFNDALITLFALGGIYAATTFHMEESHILLFGISLNIMAGVGAAAFAYWDDLFGSKRMILAALLGLIFLSSLALLAPTERLFWLAALLLALFVGPAQASSRAYLVRVVPRALTHQMFGFFALSAKVTSFLGPLLFAWMTYLSGSIRFGMSAIIALLLVGFLMMCTVSRDT